MLIKISARAEKNLDSLVQYLEKEWSKKVKEDFLQSFWTKVNLLIKNPKMCSASLHKRSIRRCVVTKQTSFFYTINKGVIEIITVQDNRIRI